MAAASGDRPIQNVLVSPNDFNDFYRPPSVKSCRFLQSRAPKPADIPVEQPTKFDLVINLTTARVLGLKVPEALLLRANEVIE